MLSRSLLRLLAVAALWSAAQAADAQPFFASESFGFTGNWTSYTTYSGGVLSGQVGAGVAPQNDLSIFGSGQNGGSVSGGNLIQSLWYSTTPPTGGPPAGYGANNPNFFSVDNSTLTSTKVFWNDSAHSSMSILQTGSTAYDLGNPSRFDPGLGLSFNASNGEWKDFTFYATVSGINGIADPVLGYPDQYTSVSTLPQGYTGYFHGIFFNNDPGGTGLYYDVNFTLNGVNNAYAAGTIVPALGITGLGPGGYFSTDAVVPEPTSCLAFIMVFAASAGYGWRRRQRREIPVVANV